MQTPAEIDSHIDEIIAQAGRFVSDGIARDEFTANHRAHYLIAATKLLTSWREAAPCPITYPRFYGRQVEFAQALSAISLRVRNDFEALGIDRPNPHYLKPPPPKHVFIYDETGAVADVITEDAGPYWPNIAEEVWPGGAAPLPRYDASGDDMDLGSRPACELQRQSRVPSPPPRALSSASTNSRPSAPADFATAASAAAIASAVGATDALLMSELLDLYLDELAQESDGQRTADRDVRPYVEFWIHIVGDRPIAAYSRTDARLFCEKVNDVPHQLGMKAQTPIARYEHAREHGWEGLKRLAETTIENRYHTALRRLYSWAKDAEHFTGQAPKLFVMGKKSLGALERDAFTDTEVRKLFGQPKFTGHQLKNAREVGPFLSQDAVYWGYCVLFLTGMRPGEIAQLEIDDIRELGDGGILYFDLRPFDPEKGRVALQDMKTLKTENSSRVIPIHPALVELGLLERARKLKDLGHVRLFPDWKWRVRADGKIKHGDMLARDWQKRKVGVTTRANVTAYSGRHSMASLLDHLELPQRDRDRILGHAHPGVAGRYGRKGALPEKIVAAFVATDAPVIKWMRQHLVAARDRAEADRKLIEQWAKKPTSDGS